MARPSRRHNLPELFDKALAHGGHTHTREDIAAGIKSGRFHYWGDEECCVVTEIHDYPQCRKLHLFIAAGDFDRMMRVYFPQVKEFARENGCVALTSHSRKGFLKRFPEFGFAPTHIVFEHKLKD